MAIELKIESYCDGCVAFEPIKDERVINGIRDVYVKCEHRSLCTYLSRKLEKHIRRVIEEENRLNEQSRNEKNGEIKKES